MCALACMITSVNAAVMFNDIPENSNEERVLNIITGVGIMQGYEDGSFMPREAVTRGEVAQILCNALGIVSTVQSETINWEEEYLGDDSKDVELMYAQSGKSIWNDVEVNHWAYKSISYVNDMGIMIGDGDGNFNPEDEVTYNEIIKCILNLSGYKTEAEYMGGYPDGYAKIATENGLSAGISGTGDSKMSRMDIARLFYNSFELPVRKIAGMSDDKFSYEIKDNPEIFMNDKMNIYAVTGTLLKTDLTSVDSALSAPEGLAQIGDIEFVFDNDKRGIRDYIGREIRAFIHDDDGTYKLLCWEETGRDEITVIDAKNFDKFDNNTFYYYNEGGSSLRRLSVDREMNLIYNGKYLGTYNNKTFDIEQGTITVIRSRSFESDIVIVEDYKAGYISLVDLDEMYLLDELAGNTGNSIIDFEPDSGKVFYDIYGASGTEILFENLSTGAVSYFVNDGYIKMYYSDKSVAGIVAATFEEDGKQYVTIDNTDYKISDTYNLSKNKITVSVGMEITAYIDVWGSIVWITDKLDTGNIGYIIKTYYDEDIEKAIIKYYEFSSKKVVTAECDENITYSNEYNTVTRVDEENLVDILSEYQGAFAFEKSQEGKIRKIEIPLNKDIESEDKRLRIMYETALGEEINYHSGVKNFSGEGFVDSGTAWLMIPEDRDSVDEYKAVSGVDNGAYSCKIYNFDKRSSIVKIALIYKSTGSYHIKYGTEVWAVTAVNDVWDEEEMETVKQITVSNGSNSKILKPDTSLVDFSGILNCYKTTDADGNGYSVSPGDLVRFYEIDGKVVNMELMYDADGKNPAWYGADPSTKTTKVPEGNENYTDVLGSLPGSTGFHNLNDINTNPFSYQNEGFSTSAKVFGHDWCHNFFAYGYMYSYYEGMFTMTTQNLHDGFSGDLNKEDYYSQTFNPSGASVVLVKKHGNTVKVQSGNVNDIRTYEQVGINCSKVLVIHGLHFAISRIFVFIDE